MKLYTEIVSRCDVVVIAAVAMLGLMVLVLGLAEALG